MSDLHFLLLLVVTGGVIALGLTWLVGKILRSRHYLLIGAIVGALLLPAWLGVLFATVGLPETEEGLGYLLVAAGFPTSFLVPWVAYPLGGSPLLLWALGGFAVLNWILLGLAVGAVLRLLHARPGATRRP